MSRAVHWMRNSAEYEALARAVYAHAAAQLERLAAERTPGTWAVALDADETVLDNSLYQLERERLGLGYTTESWTAWCRRREAGAIPGAAAFLKRARNLGGRIAIVTNRRANVQGDTEANLQALGLPFDVILTRAMDGTGEKESRWEQVSDGRAAPGLGPLDILMWIGDNIEDFPDLDQDLRHGDDSAFAGFGERYFVLPNPAYGSWEANPER